MTTRGEADSKQSGSPSWASLVAAVLALFVSLTTRSAHAQARDALPAPLDAPAVVRYADTHRAEIVAARAEARALAQRPAIVGTCSPLKCALRSLPAQVGVAAELLQRRVERAPRQRAQEAAWAGCGRPGECA